MRLVAAIASAAVPATFAPSAASGSARLGVRFQTVSAYPAVSQARASAVPMAPSPRRVSEVVSVIPVRLTAALELIKYALRSGWLPQG